MRITLISDTHTNHWELNGHLPGGDLLIHAGDIMNSGRNINDISNFCEWFNELEQYDHKVFIAGNHDRMFDDFSEKAMEIVNSYKWIDYLQDNFTEIGTDLDKLVKIYGAPWQPEFHGWAFNLPRCGQDLMRVWNTIPKDTDILITHGPPQGHLDMSGPPYNEPNLGCELLRVKVDEQPPKIHVFGHIHGGYGYKFYNGTHFFNASILNERYEYVNKPVTFDWNPLTNEIVFL